MKTELIQQALDLAQKKAHELGIAVSIAITDNHGNLAGFLRMDGSISISPKLAQTKAYTSATIGADSGDLSAYAQPGQPYYGLNSVLGGTLTTIAGGVAVRQNGAVIGGIGVGGSMDVSQDVLCAKAALSAFE